MKILFVSAEVVPFAKTGGLADVAGSLPKAIRKMGHDICVFMPLYKKVDRDKWGLRLVFEDVEVEFGPEKEKVNIYQTRMPNSDLLVCFVENRHFTDREELYVVDGKDYPDNCEAFLIFCKAAIAFVKKANWRPDIVHCNDWQSGPVALYVRELRKTDLFFKRTATVYSIHNMAYQGNFPKEKFTVMNLPDSCFGPDGLEFWDQVSFSKAGFAFADVISSVSETYAKEIQTKEYGCGLEELLQKRSEDIYGILNGVDYEIWNPATDKNLAKRFSRMTLSLRVENKLVLQKEMGLPEDMDVPLLGIVSRLDIQKGFDILAEAMEEIVGLGCQFCLLGTGDPKYHELFESLAAKYPDKVGIKLGFDAALAERIYAGSDMFLMPSRYEPCGLGQLISFKYGAIPIVRKTGGLADTVRDFDLKTGVGDGFAFAEYSSSALLAAVKRAIDVYKNKSVWVNLQKNVMDYDYSWDASARKYISLYMKAFDKVV